MLRRSINVQTKRFLSTSLVLRQEIKKSVVETPVKTSTVASTETKKTSWRKYGKFLWRATYGSAILGAGYLGYSIYTEMNPKPQSPQTATTEVGAKKKTLVILGTGWGSVSMLKSLDTSLYNVVVISPRNYFLFTPLLPSVPTGVIDLKSIVDPIRAIAKLTPAEVQYLEAEATDIDPVAKKISIKHVSQTVNPGMSSKENIVSEIDYDYLVIGVGAQPNTFGTPGVYENASFLKELSDAIEVRTKLMHNIELAQLLPKGSDERKRLLTFTVIGGGPTGVELAAEVKDYVDQDLQKWFPGIQDEVTVRLIEALPNILNMFNKKLIAYSEFVFKRINIDLKVNTMVKKVDESNVYAVEKLPNGEQKEITLPYGVLVWATGNGPTNLIKGFTSKIEAQKNARRGLLTDGTLKLEGSDDIYALGDCTFTKNAPTAQVAHQQGIYLASLFKNLAKIENLEYQIASTEDSTVVDTLQRRVNKQKQGIQDFKYKHMGALAYIGSERAVADLVWGDWQNISTGGSLTFLFWRSAYVAMCLSVRNKVLVVLDWAKVGIFGRDCSKE